MFCCKTAKKDDPEAKKTGENRPSGNAFKQQKMRTWQPVLSVSVVVPFFFLAGIVFLPLGIIILNASINIKEHIEDYTGCKSIASNKNCEIGLLPNFRKGIPIQCQCKLEFTLKEDWPAAGGIYFYYGLNSFYQNHRRYVKSRDNGQLNGDVPRPPKTNENCKADGKKSNLTIAPCGAIANSMFNDKLELRYLGSQSGAGKPVPWTQKGISWDSDRNSKFMNPVKGDKDKLKEAFKGYTKPSTWQKPLWELDTSDENDNGFLNEDFIVWMRVAALPNFRKLYRIFVPTDGEFKGGLPKGTYNLHVDYNFPVKSFGGKKKFIMSTGSWIGGKNHFLGGAYITVGIICLVFGCLFVFIHFRSHSICGTESSDKAGKKAPASRAEVPV